MSTARCGWMISVCGSSRPQGRSLSPFNLLLHKAYTTASEDILLQLGKQVKELTVSKSIIGWDLEELEKAIYAAQEREADSDDESSDGESSDNESD